MAGAKVSSVVFLLALTSKISFQDIVDHRGKEFVVSFMPQIGPSPFDMGGKNNLYISSFEDVQARVHVPSLPQQSYRQFDLKAGGIKIIPLPGSTRTIGSTGREKKKGIRITANKPMSVKGLSILSKKSEGFLGLPVDTLGKYYIVPTYFVAINAIVQVVATEDNTSVSFKLRLTQDNGRVHYGDKKYIDGDVINATLDELDVFQVLGDSDLSGTTVTSSKPIAVFSGNDCATVPKYRQPCNHLVEQIPPVSQWGLEFITNPTPNRHEGDEFHVIASMPNTLVSVDTQFKGNLNEGGKYIIEAPWNVSLVISTTQPSLVVQYSKGSHTLTLSPSMSLVPPKEWYSNDYTVYVPKDDTGNGFDSYINVVIDTSLRSGLRVKGTDDLGIAWKIISGGFSRASLHLASDGVYHVYHKNPLATFSAVLYGMASQKLFSFPVGMKWLQPFDWDCLATTTIGGDKIDNDCDNATDEELANGIDDDGDGDIDEDLVTPEPDFAIPRDSVTTPLLSCDGSRTVANTGNTGIATGSAQGVCKIRGGQTVISKKDNIKGSHAQGCEIVLERLWTIEDRCGNVLSHSQFIKISTPENPVIAFPDDTSFTCRGKKYLVPEFTGNVSVTARSCPRNVTVTHRDSYSGDCSDEDGRLDREWTVEDKCTGSRKKIQVIKLLPKDSRRTTNFVVSFRVTSERFSTELKNKASPSFKSLSYGLELELEKIFTKSKSNFGRFFVAATTLAFSNGSVVPSILIKIDAEAQIDQRQLVAFMNTTLKSGDLGKYQVDPSSVQSTDFDECQASDLNECHEKAKCTNTLGSYNCTCLVGYFGDGYLCQAPPSIYYVDPPTETGTEENATLTCHASGLPEPTFTWITPDGQAVNTTAPFYESEVLDDGSENRRGKILQDGSLLIFNTRVVDQGVYKCVAINVVGQDERRVNLTVNKDLVGVDAAITIEDEVFDKDLENKSSIRYKTIEQQVEQALTELFKDIEGFEKVIILGFYNGSVKVHFRVVVKVDKREDKEPVAIASKVGKTLKKRVETGQIGSLKVKPTVELRELPPPPVNVQSADVKQTEAVVTWSHPEFYDMYDISSYSLQVRTFGTKKWTQLTTTRGVNHRITNLDPDTVYFVRLKSENKYGKGKPSDSGELRTEKERNAAELALAIVLPLLLLIILTIVAVIVYRRWKKRGQGPRFLATDEEVPMNPVTTEPQNQVEATNDRFVTFGRERYAPIPGETAEGATAMQIQASFAWREISRDRLTLGKILGEGEFGMVVKGELTEDDDRITPCAVKKLKPVDPRDDSRVDPQTTPTKLRRNSLSITGQTPESQGTATESDFKDLLNELEIMTSVGNHTNLVNLIGACSVGGPLMIVVEFAEHGNLLRHLRDRRKQNYDDMNEYSLDISSAERVRIACDVADGMKHLASMKCAHRDLAARNVLLGEGMVAKVSDFGLSRDIYTDDVYEKKTAGKLPAKWMAVECLEQGIYTSQSDVWSFGVLLWEIETGGCAPYAGMVLSELLTKLKAGHRLDKPRYCTDWLYAIMLRCWNANPKTRPTFEELSDELHRMLRQESEYLAPDDYKGEPSYINT